MWLQLLVNAFSLGSFYALIALGFALIFGVTHAFNLAHGELIILSGYLAYSLNVGLGVPFWGVFPPCMLVLMALMAALHGLLRLVKEPFELNSLVLTFGLALVLQNLMLWGFSADYKLLAAGGAAFNPSWLPVTVTRTQLVLIVLSLVGTAAVYLLLTRTYLGKALRATIQQREAARLAGIQVQRMSLAAFAMGGLLIGLAGPLFGRNAYLHPAGGTEATLIAIIITIFAGVGKIRGILIGGWLLGLVESFTTWLVGGSWRELVSAVILIVLLLKWPQGVLTRNRTRTLP